MSPRRRAGRYSAFMSVAVSLFVVLSASLGADSPAILARVKGVVTVAPIRGPSHPGRPGERLKLGTQVRTGDNAQAVIRLPDGSEARLRPRSDLRIDPELVEGKTRFVLSFGRLWSRVVGRGAPKERFEIRTANAVAGVRGTRFEVGVGGDGSVMVSVEEGAVKVAGVHSSARMVNTGMAVEATHSGRLSAPNAAPDDDAWARWVSAHAFRLEEEGLQIAKRLETRLKRRRGRVRELRARQSKLRKEVERRAADIAETGRGRAQLEVAQRKLQELSSRLRSMFSRTQAALDLVQRWSQESAGKQDAGARAITQMAQDLGRVAPGFVDLIEEGTAVSPQDMDDMMEQMRPLEETLRDDESAADELLEEK